MRIYSLLKTCLKLVAYRGNTQGIPNSASLFWSTAIIAFTTGLSARYLSGGFTAAQASFNTLVEYMFLSLAAWTLVVIFSRQSDFMSLGAIFLGIGIIGDTGFVVARMIIVEDFGFGSISIILIFIQLIGITRAVNQYFGLNHPLSISFAIVYFIGLIGLFGFVNEVVRNFPPANGSI